jgi:hypothetical protein
MSQYIKKSVNTVLPKTTEDINAHLNKGRVLPIISIKDLFGNNSSVNKTSFEIAQKIKSKINVDFEFLETRYLSINHFELFELIYQISNETIKELQSVDVSNFEELITYSFKVLPLFLPPIDITEEEVKRSEELLKLRNEEEPFGTVISVPIESERNFLINTLRILERNKSNPEFNTSILDYLHKG